MQHGGCVVLTDAVTLQQVLGGHHLPGQPTQVESRIAGEHVGKVPWLTAAARIIFLHALCDGLHLPLLAVGTFKMEPTIGQLSCRNIREEGERLEGCTSELQASQLERHQPIANLNEVDQSIEVV